MSRIRTIKPDTFRSETLADLTLAAERTFIGLWTEVDDNGRYRDRAAVIHGALWALRPEHTVREVEADLAQLEDANLICRYEVGGIKFLHLPSWKEHQRINRPSPSKLPPCPTCTEERGGTAPENTEGTSGEQGLFEPGATVTALPVSERRG